MSLTLSNLTHINLYLDSIADFSAINTIYSQFFGSSPPTRACIGSASKGKRVWMDVIGYSGSDQRAGVHVQGISYWAPANIGPYSQAILISNRLSIAGQIGLIPASLQLPSPRSFAMEVALALKHVRSVMDVMREGNGGWHGWMEGGIVWVDRGYKHKVDSIREAWKGRSEFVRPTSDLYSSFHRH